MDQCEFFSQFLSHIQSEISNSSKVDLNLNRLNSALQDSLQHIGLHQGAGLEVFIVRAGTSILDHAKAVCKQSKEAVLQGKRLPVLGVERITFDWREPPVIGEFIDPNAIGLNVLVGDLETSQYQILHRIRSSLLSLNVNLSQARLMLQKLGVRLI
jgi:hypothetical protein